MRKPLEGVRVLDLTIWQQGTYATALMADLGADVIKIEERASGDPGRFFQMQKDLGLSPYFEAHNRGKRSVALDLKSPEGRDVLLRLAQDADVFLTNYRVGAMQRLRLTYDDLSAANPRLVYVQASGHGHLGDDADLGSFDFLAQARGGIMSVTGEPDDPPMPAGVPQADQVGGMHACIAAISGVLGARTTGRGMRLDTSLLGSQLSLQSFDITGYLFTGRQRQRTFRGGGTPFWRTYQAGDGKWFVIGMLLERGWPDVAHVIGRPEIVDDPRFATFRERVIDNAPALIEILTETFATAPAREWIDKLNAIGMFSAPVQDYAEVADDPQVTANSYIHEVEHPGHEPVRMTGSGFVLDGEPVRIERLAPQHGEHTEAVLVEAGYTWDEIAKLREAGAIGPKGSG